MMSVDMNPPPTPPAAQGEGLNRRRRLWPGPFGKESVRWKIFGFLNWFRSAR
jgi:hypothetical protein